MYQPANWRVSRAIFAAILLASWAGICKGETLSPKQVSYENEIKDDAYAHACHIVLLIMNLPSPEVVNFHYLTTRQKSDGKMFGPFIAGFTIDVGDLKFSNGLPSGQQKANLSSASFTSPHFNSVGRLNVAPMGDGGLLASTLDHSTASEFFKAFTDGKFEISFSRNGSSFVRTYTMNTTIPSDVLRKFIICIKTL